MTNLRGNPSAAVSDRLAAAGYSTSQMLAVVLAVGMKTLSNYTNHMASTPIDDAFQPAPQSA